MRLRRLDQLTFISRRTITGLNWRVWRSKNLWVKGSSALVATKLSITEVEMEML